MKKPLVDNQKVFNPLFWLSGTLVIGALMRFYHSTSISLWHDEAFSALYLRYSWGEMMHRISLDVHPPLYYWLLRLWTGVFDDGLFAMRAMSILFGILTIYFTYLFVKHAFSNEKVAVLAAFFVAINPFQIQYGWEARMYTLGTFLLMLSSYLLVKALKDNKTRHWILYALAIALSLYTHYFLFFSVAAHGLYFVYHCFKTKNWHFKGWLSFLVGGVLFIPWLPTLIQQITRVSDNYWIQGPNAWAVASTFWTMYFGGYGTDHLTLGIFAPVALVILVFFIRRVQPPMRWLIVLSVIVPVIGALLVSFMQSIYLDRYFYFASLFFSIMLACLLFNVPKYTTRRTLATIFAIVSIAVFFKNWKDLDVNNRPGMRAAAEYINERANSDDKIYVGLSAVYFTFKYYNQTPIHPLLFSTSPFEKIPHFSGTAILNADDIILDFKQTEKDDTVWLLWTDGFYGTKPNVPGNWQKINEQEFRDTPWFKGTIYVTSYHVD